MSTPTVSHRRKSKTNTNNVNVEAPSPLDIANLWKNWGNSLAQQTSKSSRNKSNIHGSFNALLWSLPQQATSVIRNKFKELFGSGGVSAAKNEKIEELAAEWVASPVHNTPHSWEALVWANCLLTHASSLNELVACSLFTKLEQLIQQGSDASPLNDPLLFQWLAVEIPARLALGNPNCVHSKEWLKQAQQGLTRLCTEVFDAQGLPSGRFITVLPAILASWVRCRQMPQSEQLLTPLQNELFTKVVQHVLQFQVAQQECPWSHALQLHEECLGMAVTMTGNRKISQRYKQNVISNERLSIYSEDGKIASMRSHAGVSSPALHVAFDGPEILLALSSELCILNGAWTHELSVNGVNLMPSQNWEEVLWFTDTEVSYLELETWFGNEWQVQRQMLLNHADGFAYMADVILGPAPAKVNYSSHYKLAENITATAETETREIWLENKSKRHLVIPLLTPEWRCEPSAMELSATANRLTLSTQATGQRHYLPLVINLHATKAKLDYTWRRLTVAEQLQILPSDVAVAARLQIGDMQWGVYRSLADRGNRTFLGKNLITEFFLGKFHRNGAFDTLMEVE